MLAPLDARNVLDGRRPDELFLEPVGLHVLVQ